MTDHFDSHGYSLEWPSQQQIAVFGKRRLADTRDALIAPDARLQRLTNVFANTIIELCTEYELNPPDYAETLQRQLLQTLEADVHEQDYPPLYIRHVGLPRQEYDPYDPDESLATAYNVRRGGTFVARAPGLPIGYYGFSETVFVQQETEAALVQRTLEPDIALHRKTESAVKPATASEVKAALDLVELRADQDHKIWSGEMHNAMRQYTRQQRKQQRKLRRR